ncbi:MAG: hypothetical protein EA421_12230 [Gemmatimonadales bacterium]|nr:MAG: hypothetical protein EA421_12230 [Gemmatimonadales bacterium]
MGWRGDDANGGANGGAGGGAGGEGGGGRPGNGPEDDPFKGTREEMDKVIRNLDMLEWVILFLATGLALGGGALVAWILSVGTRLPFRLTWAVLSVLLLVIPAFVVFGREARERGRERRSLRSRDDTT